MINWALGKNIIEKAFRESVAEACKELKSRIEELTPVGDPSLWGSPAPEDYSPGTLKASWEMVDEGKSIVIRNDQPYAYRVEYGWSSQAPQGMVRVALKEFDTMLNKAVRRNKI